MKVVVLFVVILFILLIFKMISGRNNIKTYKKDQNQTTIDLEEDPNTKEY